MKLYAGIDGGQSSTRAVIADEAGQILAKGRSGPCDYVDEAPNSLRLDRALNDALSDAARIANLDPSVQYAAVVAGISGHGDQSGDVRVNLPSRQIRLLHDAPVAWAGAFGGEPGVIVIAGTGSVAYGRDAAQRIATLGGWGYLFGDEGSAFWVARQALAHAMAQSDAGRSSALEVSALRFFKEPSLREIAHAFYAREISRPQLARFAGAVIDAAQDGDRAALGIFDEATTALALLAQRVAAALESGMTPKIAFLGGFMRRDEIRQGAQEKLRRMLPRADIVRPQFEPAVGALMLAYQEDGQQVPFLQTAVS